MGADDVGVFALEEALGKLHADAVRLLRRDLARLEGLAHLVGYEDVYKRQAIGRIMSGSDEALPVKTDRL